MLTSPISFRPKLGNLVVLGTSALARELADLWLDMSGLQATLIPEDRWFDSLGRGLACINDSVESDTSRGRTANIAIGVEDLRTRLHLCLAVERLGYLTPALIHPTATISSDATCGVGVVAMSRSSVNVHAVLGRYSVVRERATVDHGCLVGDGVLVGTGANLAGDVTVGSCAQIGAGAVVKQGLVIGMGACVFPGSVVLKDVEPGREVRGIPAR